MMRENGQGGETNTSRVIAIDGPAAAGKTTVARALAARVGAIFLDTGLLYRALTLEAFRRGVAPSNGEGLAALVPDMHLTVAPASVADGRAHDVLVRGEDVTVRLRTPEIDLRVSEVSAHPAVRSALLPIQRRIAASGPVVMAGRDIATVVAPDAGVKIYLDASLVERARRRCLELTESGRQADFQAVRRDLERRDRIDSTRQASPLQQHHDAIVINTDGLTQEQVVERVAAIVRKAWNGSGRVF
jgi:cytidylate kinase